MRAAGPIAVLALLGGVAASAQSLPPAPYQVDQGREQGYAPRPQTVDRYGGFQRSGATRGRPSDSAPRAAPSGARLAWAGKVETQPQAGPSQGGGWTSMGRQWDAYPAAPRQPQPQSSAFQAQAASQSQWRPYTPPTVEPRQAPTSIYDPPAQPAPPAAADQPPAYRTAQAVQGGPRFYSLHREYGIQPDAIPLPPQFFGPTADLSAPVTDPLARRTTTVNGQTRTVAVPDAQADQ